LTHPADLVYTIILQGFPAKEGKYAQDLPAEKTPEKKRARLPKKNENAQRT
jgi:hypothetical protein